MLLWTGEDTCVDTVRREAIAQAVRQRQDAVRTVAEAAAREGMAFACAGLDGTRSDLVAVPLGWTPLGLPWLGGDEHAIATARPTGGASD